MKIGFRLPGQQSVPHGQGTLRRPSSLFPGALAGRRSAGGFAACGGSIP